MNTKAYVLNLLETNRGQSVSGAQIANQLGLSRNAVWKAIKELEKDGHQITAVTNKGYKLDKESDILSIQGITPHLQNKELAKGIILHDSIDSTNRQAKELAIAGAAHGSTIIASTQTLGKGRFGRDFFSPPNSGIYMSLILDPQQLKFEAPTMIIALTALAVCTAIENVSNKKPSIKWANDVFIEGKKVCGISTEAAMDFETGQTQWIVVGIGINVHAPKSGVPKNLQEVIGFVFDRNDTPAARNQIAADLINKITDPPKELTAQEVLRQYRDRLFMLGKKVSVSAANESYEATALDIDDKGQLIVKKEDGKTVTLFSGEVSVKPHMNT